MMIVQLKMKFLCVYMNEHNFGYIKVIPIEMRECDKSNKVTVSHSYGNDEILMMINIFIKIWTIDDISIFCMCLKNLTLLTFYIKKRNIYVCISNALINILILTLLGITSVLKLSKNIERHFYFANSCVLSLP